MFYRFWNESGATANDFDRVAALVRSQVRSALLAREGPTAWDVVERRASSGSPGSPGMADESTGRSCRPTTGRFEVRG